MRKLIKQVCIVNLILNIIMFILIIMPRKRTRRIRHFFAKLFMELWVGVSRAFAMIYEDLWQKGNGY